MSQLLTIKSSEKYLKLIKLFGLAPFSVMNGNSVTKLGDIVFAVINLAICVLILSTIIDNQEQLKTNKSVIVDTGSFATYIFSLLVDVISMTMSSLLRHHIWKIVITLQSVDEVLRRSGFPENHNKLGQIYCVVMTVVVSITIPMSYFVYVSHPIVIKALIYLYSGTFFILCNQTASLFLLLIYLRLARMSQCLRFYKEGKLRSHRSKAEYFKSMNEIYFRLMQALQTTSFCYGLSLMFETALLFFYSMFSIFMIYKDVIEGTVDKITVATILFAVYFCFFILFTILCSILIEWETTNISKGCNEVMRMTKDKTEIEVLISLSSQIQRSSPKFSCGLFDFDLKLVFGVR